MHKGRPHKMGGVVKSGRLQTARGRGVEGECGRSLNCQIEDNLLKKMFNN